MKKKSKQPKKGRRYCRKLQREGGGRKGKKGRGTKKKTPVNNKTEPKKKRGKKTLEADGHFEGTRRKVFTEDIRGKRKEARKGQATH